MASITTILGTHSLSSSRLTINNNFDNVNEELGLIANVLDTTSSTLSLTGAITAGTLSLNTGTLNTFNVTASSLEAGVEATFKENVILEKALQFTVAPTATFPAGTVTPTLGAYIYTGSADVELGPSADGQILTIIASTAFQMQGTGLDNINGAYTSIDVLQNGSISFIGSTDGTWWITGSHKATIS